MKHLMATLILALGFTAGAGFVGVETAHASDCFYSALGSNYGASYCNHISAPYSWQRIKITCKNSLNYNASAWGAKVSEGFASRASCPANYWRTGQTIILGNT